MTTTTASAPLTRTPTQTEGYYLAIHEFNHIRNQIDKAITSLTVNPDIETRAKLYAVNELLRLDVTIRERIQMLEGR